MKPSDDKPEPNKNEKEIKMKKYYVQFVFPRHPDLHKVVTAHEHFAALGKAMELTVERWPVVRPIVVKVSEEVPPDQCMIGEPGDGGEEFDIPKCYRVTKDWKIVEDDQPYISDQEIENGKTTYD